MPVDTYEEYVPIKKRKKQMAARLGQQRRKLDAEAEQASARGRPGWRSLLCSCLEF